MWPRGELPVYSPGQQETGEERWPRFRPRRRSGHSGELCLLAAGAGEGVGDQRRLASGSG